MRTFRRERVASLIQEELSKLVAREMEFSPGDIVTITGVDVSSGLERAVVRLAVIPSSSAPAALGIIEKARGGLQHLLMKKINIKPMPQIFFEIDVGAENAAEVEKILKEENNK